MIVAIIEILVGIFIWQFVPANVKIGKKKKTQKTFRLVCTIVGLIFVIGGALSLIASL